MARNKILGNVSMTLTAVGGLNWGLVGVTSLMGKSFNLVNYLLGSMPVLENSVYILVGAGTVYLIGKAFKWWK